MGFGIWPARHRKHELAQALRAGEVMNMQERMACLQLKIGSCSGCPVRERAIEAMRVDRVSEVTVLVKAVANGDCPDEVAMQIPRRQEQSVW